MARLESCAHLSKRQHRKHLVNPETSGPGVEEQDEGLVLSAQYERLPT